MFSNLPLTKILIIGVVITVVVGGLVAFRLFFSPNSSSEPESLELVKSPSTASGSAPVPSTNSQEERVRNLEISLAEIVDVLKNNKSSSSLSSSTTTSLDSRVKTLETSVADLKARVLVLEGKTTNSTTSSKPPAYIPLRWVASTTSSDWSNPGVAEVSISGADYPGYTSMVLQLSIKTETSGNRAYGRLFNKDDNSSLTTSEASTDVAAYTQASSGGFTIPSGRKSYYLQMKSQNGVGAYIQDATIKVNF